LQEAASRGYIAASNRDNTIGTSYVENGEIVLPSPRNRATSTASIKQHKKKQRGGLDNCVMQTSGKYKYVINFLLANNSYATNSPFSLVKHAEFIQKISSL